MGSDDPSNVTYPYGSIAIDPTAQEITGHNPERQDFIIGPNPASNFAGYFVARFDQPFASYGVIQNGTNTVNATTGEGTVLSGYATFPESTQEVTVRVGVSFISVDQARRNLDKEIPDGTSLEQTAYNTRKAWADKLDLIEVEGASKANLTTFYTGFYHSLQYPYEQDEDGQYYSGYDDTVHQGASYTGYSIWVCSSVPVSSAPLSLHRIHSAPNGHGKSFSSLNVSQTWLPVCSKTTKKEVGCLCGRTSSVSSCQNGICWHGPKKAHRNEHHGRHACRCTRRRSCSERFRR